MIADIYLTNEFAGTLHVAPSDMSEAYFKVEVVDPVEMMPPDKQSFDFLGVVVSGPLLGHYVVLRKVDTIPEIMAPVNEAAFCLFHAFGNELLEAGKAYEFTMNEADDAVAIGYNVSETSNDVLSNVLYVKEYNADNVRDKKASEKRKRSAFPSVHVEGKGELKTRKAQQAAATWIEAQDRAYFDKYKVHLVRGRNIIVNGRLQYASIQEQYEHVESKTGRNFMEDVRKKASDFNMLFDDSDFKNLSRWLDDMSKLPYHDDVHMVLTKMGDISETVPEMEIIMKANLETFSHLNEISSNLN